ncbi:hypothetical protein QVD17_04659 [Tagetes erecta]|uniref:WAT1-related protein n=1 Tax=Tagetes erecta TaxID=13708 RepID=A0AAD8LCB6_TARER|nr:hypothetical protein QVD17_04659 [Tagetes erecta]
MNMISTDSWSWKDDVLPFVAMLMKTCLDMAMLTVVKAAMNDGMGTIVYIIYHNALGTLILLPLFILHIIRAVDRPPLTFRILFRLFILGLLGVCLFEILVFVGVDYSSPTMASAISNLSPGITFLIAVIFRMEKMDTRSSSSVAKLLGTLIAISGAMLFTFYQGPEIFHIIQPRDSPNELCLSQQLKWKLGGLIIVSGGIFGCIWNVLQIDLFYLKAVYFTVIHSNVFTWCLRKKGPIYGTMFSPLSIVIAVSLGVTYLGDSLHLGSAIGATIVSIGFYTVLWGQAKEKSKITALVIKDEDGSSHQTAPLLASINNESRC